jgi:hypothetical protein
VKEERWPEVIPAAVPPLVFLRWLAAASISYFSCFSAATFREGPEDPLYNCF